jgi:hypothetical protein
VAPSQPSKMSFAIRMRTSSVRAAAAPPEAHDSVHVGISQDPCMNWKAAYHCRMRAARPGAGRALVLDAHVLGTPGTKW